MISEIQVQDKATLKVVQYESWLRKVAFALMDYGTTIQLQLLNLFCVCFMKVNNISLISFINRRHNYEFVKIILNFYKFIESTF